jgi:hypothetical protein
MDLGLPTSSAFEGSHSFSVIPKVSQDFLDPTTKTENLMFFSDFRVLLPPSALSAKAEMTFLPKQSDPPSSRSNIANDKCGCALIR